MNADKHLAIGDVLPLLAHQGRKRSDRLRGNVDSLLDNVIGNSKVEVSTQDLHWSPQSRRPALQAETSEQSQGSNSFRPLQLCDLTSAFVVSDEETRLFFLGLDDGLRLRSEER